MSTTSSLSTTAPKMKFIGVTGAWRKDKYTDSCKSCVLMNWSLKWENTVPGISYYLVSRSKQVNRLIIYSWTRRQLSYTGKQGGKIIIHKTRTLETGITNLIRWNLCRGVIFLSNLGWYFWTHYQYPHIYHKKSFLLALTTVGKLCHFLVRMRWLGL